VYHSKGEQEKAIADYSEAIRLRPDNPIAFYNRADVYEERKEYDKAEADRDEAIRLCPGLDCLKETLTEPQIIRAEIISAEENKLIGNWPGNRDIANLTAAILLLPNNAVLLNNRAWKYAMHGEYDRAIADWTEALRLSPENKIYLDARGDICAKKGDHDKTAADRNEAARLKQKFDQDHPDLSIWVNSISRNTDIDINLRLYLSQDIDKIISENKEQPEKLAAAYLKESLSSFLNNDERKGREYLEKALDIYSGMDQAEAGRLKSAFLADFTDGISGTLNGFDKTIADWTELIEKQPENPGNFLNDRGKAYAEKACHYKTIAGWIGAMGAEPEAGARFQAYTSEYDRAVADYTAAIESNNLEPGALSYVYQNRGTLHADWGDYDKAIADYDESIRLSPGDTHYYGRGIVHDILGDYDKAIANYTEAIRLTLKHPQSEYFYNRGIVYDEKGEYEKAIADYTQAMRHLARGLHTNALHNRYLAYKATGQHEKAEADFAKLKSRFPEYKKITYRRGRNKVDRAIYFEK
jgi:tetratricopeptide (TPR) repeat protein